MCENGTFNQDVKCLKKLQSDCHIRKEPVLEYYCDCMLKIRRAYYKAEQTDLLFYIKQIMSAAFPLVVKYFVLCVEEYHKETDFCQRARILRDIEESVVKFDEMFDSIIHATNSVDRILFQTAPIATATHIAAPKLCAYSEIWLLRISDIEQWSRNKDSIFYCGKDRKSGDYMDTGV